MYTKFVKRQSKLEPDSDKRNILLQSEVRNDFVVSDVSRSPEVNALAIHQLSSPANSIYYNVEKKRKLVFPQDHIRHSGFISDWYFLVGQLQSESGEKYAFVSVFQGFYIMGPDLLEKGEDIEDTHIEQIMWTFTSEKDQITSVAPNVAILAKNMVLPSLKKFAIIAPNYSLQGTGANPFPMKIEMHNPKNSTSMTLRAKDVKPILLQGDKGYVGIESLGEGWGYYSYPRLDLSGIIEYKGRTIEVTGIGWFDHQWGTTGFVKNPLIRYFTNILSLFGDVGTFAGWNWFAVQVETKDKQSIEFTTAYGNSYKDGQVDIVSTPHKAMYGNISLPDGTNRKVDGDILITTLAYTHSPKTHFKYPIKWLIQVPKEEFEVVMTAISPHQFGYHVYGTEWAENACSAEGTYRGKDVTGIGWGECVGYEDQNRVNKVWMEHAGINSSSEKLKALREAPSRTTKRAGIFNILLILLCLIMLGLSITLIVVLVKKRK